MEVNETWQEARSRRPLSTSSTKFMFFGPIVKSRWPPWPLIGWDIFDFSFEIAERNSTNLEIQRNLTGSKISTSSTEFVFFRADQKKMAAPVSRWLRHFQLFLLNRRTEFKETWQEARSQRRLLSLFCWVENGRPGQFIKKVAHCTQVIIMWSFGSLLIL